MRTEDLVNAIGGVDDELLERSERAKNKKRRSLSKWIGLAACACIVIALGVAAIQNGWLRLGVLNGMSDSSVNETAEDREYEVSQNENGSDGILNGSESIVYFEGTLFTMTSLMDCEEIVVTRDILHEVSEVEGALQMKVEDSYVLENTSDIEYELELVYLYDMQDAEKRPILTDEAGEELDTKVYEEGLAYIGNPVLEAYVTIPAGESVKVTATQYKYSAEADNIEVIDQFMKADKYSKFHIVKTTATLVELTDVELLEQNMGFDLEAGIRTVELEADGEYYLQLKMAE